MHLHNRVREGHSNVHIVRDLLLGLGSDDAATEVDPGIEGEHLISATNFEEKKLRELDEARAAVKESKKEDADLMNVIDSNFTSKILSASKYDAYFQ